MDQKISFVGTVITYAQLYAFILYSIARFGQGSLWLYSRKMSGSFWVLSIVKFCFLQGSTFHSELWLAFWGMFTVGQGVAGFNFYESCTMNGKLVSTILGMPIPKKTWQQVITLGVNDLLLYGLCMYLFHWILEIFF